MGRIDIVVFPNGGREIFGRIGEVPVSSLIPLIESFITGLEKTDTPRKFTGYYDSEDASDIHWQPYDADNPIVQIPYENEGSQEDMSDGAHQEKVSVELAQVPLELRETCLS